MAARIEDYAMIGDCQTAALVGRNGSIDWLCLPRFDAPSCFSALLGHPGDGRWLLAPKAELVRQSRRYLDGTLVLETTFECREGAVRLIDFMPLRDGRRPHVVRIVEGVDGKVTMRMELVLRFDYGSIVPWVRSREGALYAIGGRDAVRLLTPVPVRGQDFTSVAEFEVRASERLPFLLSWHFSYEDPPPPVDAEAALARTTRWWRAWSGRCALGGTWHEPVQRSLITLRALADDRTGGIVAAPTTSLPEEIGGVRNWDYRYCWVRDATFTLLALLEAGYKDEAIAWRDWILRAVAGSPGKIQIMYGVGGERRLTELTLPHLAGYEGSRPVRIGNAASTQLQLDVYGELLDCMYHGRRCGLAPDPESWRLESALLESLHDAWHERDEGIWEVRGARRHFTHSKVMSWVAMDRAIKGVETYGLPGPVEKWRATRAAIWAEVCDKGYAPSVGAFTQCYGSKDLDASLLLMPLVGFLPVTDPRVARTVEAIQRHLSVDGFLMRYTSHDRVDGVAGRDGVFLPCTFWLADCLAMMGRTAEARATFERVLRVRNDVGLLAEEYDPRARRLLGNFPQAFSHVALVSSAINLSRESDVPIRASEPQAIAPKAR
jgi:GH15 family glucan-1,4-alpha-glucosidase